MTLILHLGAPKCGSSSLQAALSANPRVQSKHHGSIQYAYINHQGQLLDASPEKVPRIGHFQSAGFNRQWSPSEQTAGELAEAINRRAGGSDALMLSSEAWLYSDHFVYHGFLDKLECDVEVIVWVRPQVPYLNSAWWQWGAWAHGIAFDGWLQHQLRRCQWGHRLGQWREQYNFRYRVHPACGDTVADFCRIYGVEDLSSARLNTGLDATVLRFLQQNRSLRRNAHDADVAFVLGRYLEPGAGGAPWVLSRTFIGEALAFSESSNRRLLDFLDPDDAERVRRDRSWWDPEAYGHKVQESPYPVPLSSAELNQLSLRLVAALERADREKEGRRAGVTSRDFADTSVSASLKNT